MEEIILRENIETCRVSSVLNRDSKSFGKKFLFDGNEETCWNSEKGSPQWISLDLVTPVTISTFQIQFQGGFVGRNCKLKLKIPDGSEYEEEFYPDDSNSLQTFRLQRKILVKSMTWWFDDSTDFYGRIIIYSINVGS